MNCKKNIKIFLYLLFSGDNHRQWTAFTTINKSLSNQVPSSPQVQTCTQNLTNSVQGISLNTPNMSTQVALDNAIASIMNSPTSTSGVQVISSGISIPSQSISQTPTSTALNNALLKSVTLVKRNLGDTATGEYFVCLCLRILSNLLFTF